jgi:chromosome segregation ATPase
MNTDWLEDLEARVAEATEEILRLRGANEELRAELIELRAHAESTPDHGQASWTEERDAVRARVEKLAAHLEGLLAT